MAQTLVENCFFLVLPTVYFTKPNHQYQFYPSLSSEMAPFSRICSILVSPSGIFNAFNRARRTPEPIFPLT